MSDYKPGEKWLITCNAWFYGPDGRQYRGAFGTIQGIHGDEQTLGIKTNRNATNWYLRIGGVVIAGCQIHYAVRTDECHTGPVDDWNEKEGVIKKFQRPSSIFNADAVGR